MAWRRGGGGVEAESPIFVNGCKCVGVKKFGSPKVISNLFLDKPEVKEQSSTAISFLDRMSDAPRELDTGGMLSDANWRRGAKLVLSLPNVICSDSSKHDRGRQDK